MSERLWPDGTLIQEGDHLIFYKYSPKFYGRENEFNECTQERFVSLMRKRFGPGWQPKDTNGKGWKEAPEKPKKAKKAKAAPAAPETDTTEEGDVSNTLGELLGG